MAPQTRPSPLSVWRHAAALSSPIGEAVLCERSLTCHGIEFTRRDADRVALLSICRRRATRAADGGDLIDVLGRLSPTRPLGVRCAVLTIDEADTLAGDDVAGPVRAIFPLGGGAVPIRLTAEAVAHQLVGGGLQLLRISIDHGDVLREIDRSPIEAGWWFAWGGGAEVVDDVVLVVDSDLARMFDTDAPVTLSAGNGGAVEISVTGGRSGRCLTTLPIERGVCIAYRLARRA